MFQLRPCGVKKAGNGKCEEQNRAPSRRGKDVNTSVPEGRMQPSEAADLTQLTG